MFESDDLRGLLLSLTSVKSLAVCDVMHACLYSDESHFRNLLVVPVLELVALSFGFEERGGISILSCS